MLVSSLSWQKEVKELSLSNLFLSPEKKIMSAKFIIIYGVSFVHYVFYGVCESF